MRHESQAGANIKQLERLPSLRKFSTGLRVWIHGIFGFFPAKAPRR
jgi:hypothetical protein